MFVTAWIGPDFARDLGLFFEAFIQLTKDQSGSAQVRACVYSSFGKERRDGQGQPEDTTIPLLRLLLPTRGGTVRYLSLDEEHGPRIQSRTVIFFLTSERGENKSGGQGREEVPWTDWTGLALAKDES